MIYTAELDFWRNAGRWLHTSVKLGGKAVEMLICTSCSFGVRQVVEWLNCAFLILVCHVCYEIKSELVPVYI